MSFSLDTKSWAQQQFSSCELGDRRRTKRLIEVAEQVANNPSGSFPKQMNVWSNVKAAYRLFATDDVTFRAVAEPHWKQTRQCKPGRYLVLGDTTELDFGYQREIAGLAPVGPGNGRGFLLHNGILVDAENKAVLGVAGQTIHYRQPAPKKESQAKRFKRERESKVWGDVIDQIGPPQKGVQ